MSAALASLYRRGALAALLAGLACGTAVAASSAVPTVPGSWQRLPTAPISPDYGSQASVWTGRRLLVFGRDEHTALDAHGHPYSIGSVNVAASYDLRTRTWRQLTPPKGPGYSPNVAAAWTGKEMLVWGSFEYEAYSPATNRWRKLPPAPTTGGAVVWTGRELIGWGGGCCGDAFSDGSAYNPRTNSWRRLPRSPLAGSQHPQAVWTGSKLIVLVGDRNPDTGRPWPARLARAAAYDPAANRWSRIARPPAAVEGGTAAWDGRELVVAGGAAHGARRFSSAAYGYDPASNRWRRLAPLPSPRAAALAVWTGGHLLLVGGSRGVARGNAVPATRVLAYDPRANRWAVLPRTPLPAKLVPTATWNGRTLFVWGGYPTGTWGRFNPAGATFTPKEGS